MTLHLLQTLVIFFFCLWSALVQGQNTISTNKVTYALNEAITISWSYTSGQNGDWVAIYPSTAASPLPSGSVMWVYIRSLTQTKKTGTRLSGSVTFDANAPVETGSQAWPLAAGSYKMHLVRDVAAPYPSVASSATFTVTAPAPAPMAPAAPSPPVSSNPTCIAATTAVSTTNTHIPPLNGMVVTKVGFGSCFKPASQTSAALWQHVRNQLSASSSVWVWLGDNMYADTDNANTKRIAYNTARNDPYYSQYGPVANPKIPTTGTWDDHDFAWNNMGKEYKCRKESQNEFAYHFNLPSSGPRHPSQGSNQQPGIYSANMFNKDASTPNGIHLITLDARYHRSPTFSNYGPCEGAASSMLGATQWTWLQQELNKPSEIKIIASGVQVLPPTNQNAATSHCAYDGPSGTFVAANAAVGEGPGFPAGTSYEQWGEMPQERTKLLHMCQESINAGKTKQIIFLSGDQHWAEIMVKKVPARTGQAAVTLYEVTASGIDQNWNEVITNANRFRPRLANNAGTGAYVNECLFPFTYQGVVYNDCTSIDNAGIEWCYYNSANAWGNCQPKADMVVPTARSTSTKLNSCSGQAMHVCTAKANYGSIDVNWSSNEVTMNIFTPHQTAQPLAASVTIPL